MEHAPTHPPPGVWRKLRRSPSAVAGLLVVLLFALAGLLAPWLTAESPVRGDPARMNEPPSWVDPGARADVAPAAQRRPLGRDVAGRDILARLLHGARTSLAVGLAVVALATLVGVLVGGLAGYFGGWADTVLMRLTDVMLAFPFLILAIAVASIVRQATLVHVALVLGLTSWPTVARLARAQVLVVREEAYVAAARALGAGHTAILLRHVAPNCAAPVIVWASMGIAGAVMAESALSFLGLGPVDGTSWGGMIATGLKAHLPDEWWPVVFPSLALAAMVLALNLLGDALQDAMNPRSRA